MCPCYRNGLLFSFVFILILTADLRPPLFVLTPSHDGGSVNYSDFDSLPEGVPNAPQTP